MKAMKVGIIGVGAVGTSCAKTMIVSGVCHELALLDENRDLARGVATDLSHGEPLCASTRIIHGDYEILSGAEVVVITAGINERSGGAIDRNDPRGRLLLLPDNANVYADVVPRIAEVAPDAVLVVVTDPPDALADVARQLTDTNPILSTGTFLDTLRFQVQIGRRLDCRPSSVEAMVIGEHGTSQVYLWSHARVGGEGVLQCAARKGFDPTAFREEVVQAVKYANIDIIEGTGASRQGIGIVTARIVNAILRDEKLVAPVGTFHPDFGVTLSLPSVIRSGGVSDVLRPVLSNEEARALAASAKILSKALETLGSVKERQVVVRPVARREEAKDNPQRAPRP